MAELRWILLGVAVIAILGIYFFSRSRKKVDSSSPLDAANDMPSFNASRDNVKRPNLERPNVKNSEQSDDWSHGVGPVRVVGKTDREIIQAYDDMPSISASHDDMVDAHGDYPGDDRQDGLEENNHLAGRKRKQPIEAWSEEPVAVKFSAEKTTTERAAHSSLTSRQSESDKIQATHSQSGKFEAGKFEANKFQYEKNRTEKTQSEKTQSEKNQSRNDEPTINQTSTDQAIKNQAVGSSSASQQPEENTAKTSTEKSHSEATAGTDQSAVHNTTSNKQQSSKAAPAAPAEVDDVIAVYVIAGKDEPPIKGEKILSASYALHLQYGEMKIFHRYAEAVDSSLGRKDILFSMANVQQPGYFDIDDMHNITSTGMSFFMQVNLVDDPSRVLDDMLICAHRMSIMLGVELCNAQRKPLDESSTNALREQVELLLEYRDNQLS